MTCYNYVVVKLEQCYFYLFRNKLVFFSSNSLLEVKKIGLSYSILVLLIPLLFILALAGAIVAGVKSSQQEGGEDVIKNIYVYLVLFVTLMMVIGGSVSAFMAAVDIIAPTPYYQTFEDYKRWNKEKVIEGETKEKIEVSDEELRRDYEAMIQGEKQRQIERSKNSLIKSFGWIVIPLPILLYFQGLRKKAIGE